MARQRVSSFQKKKGENLHGIIDIGRRRYPHIIGKRAVAKWEYSHSARPARKARGASQGAAD